MRKNDYPLWRMKIKKTDRNDVSVFLHRAEQ